MTPPPRDNIPERVSAVETSLMSMGREIHSVRGDVSSLRAEVNQGFNTLRDAMAGGSRTNWGWVISAVGVGVVIVGAVGAAYVEPVRRDQSHTQARLDRMGQQLDYAWEQAIRADERQRAARP